MNKFLILVLLFTTGFISCKTTGGIFGNKIRELSVAEVNTNFTANRIEYSTFSSKSKIDIAGPGISQSVTANIDMVKDSMIGMSLRVIGVEGARILITPDSVKVIDRLNQTYLAKGYQYIREQFALDIPFSDLQNLIAGNPLLYDSTTLTPGVAEDKYVLFSKSGVYKNTVWLTPDFSLSRMFIEELEADRNITLTYAGIDKIEGKPFAFMRTILIDAQSNFTATIEFTKVTLNEPIEFAFTVNSKYQRIE